MTPRLALLALFVAACSGSAGTDAGVDAPVATDAGSDTGVDASLDAGVDLGVDAGPSTTVGGARPARVVVPETVPSSPAPLVILLHGYGASGAVQDAYLGFSAYTRTHGIYFIAPDGELDATGMRSWNATDACCGDHVVDDVAYLRGLIAETSSRFPIDPTRVYFAGHSNGGFMSYRMACDDAPEIAAIASLAGATWLDESRCMAANDVSVLQISGTADTMVPYDGTAEFPGGRTSVERWATRAHCDLTMPMAGAPLDLETTIAGDETTTLYWTVGCDAGNDEALWTVVGGSHIPAVPPDFAERVITWLMTHHR